MAEKEAAVSLSTSSIVDAVFPYDAPSNDEEFFLSVSCGEDTMTWASHEGENFEASCVWNTPYLEVSERTVQPCMTLSRFLPEQVVTYIFGDVGDEHSNPKNAAKMAATRKIPALSVYILVATTTSEDATDMVEQQEADIAWLFRDIPARLLRMNSQHFFSNEAPQPMLSTNKAAALYAAVQKYGAPALLIDAGVTIVYLAVDQNSAILGGGVGLGLKIRLDALSNYTSSVESYPLISYETFRQTLQSAAEQKKPIPCFAPDPATGMMAAVVSEAAGHLRSIANHFLEKIKPATTNPIPTPDIIPQVTIAITGDDAPFVKSLFQPDCSCICNPESGTVFPANDKIKVVVEKNLMSMGISHLLRTNSLKKNTSNTSENFRDRAVGLRGARAASFQNKPGIYRGTFVRVIRGKSLEADSYEIVFDCAGDKELLNQVELYDALRLYEEVNEASDDDAKLFCTERNQEASRLVQNQLVKSNKDVANQKVVLDCMKESEGSIASLLGTPKVAKRGRKRNRHSFEGDPKQHIDKRIAKWFDDGNLYFGTVDKVSRQDEKDTWWHVEYDDGDQEDLDYQQILRAFKDYEENKSQDTTLRDGN